MPPRMHLILVETVDLGRTYSAVIAGIIGDLHETVEFGRGKLAEITGVAFDG